MSMIKDGSALKGYCVQCRADWPNSPELWKVSWLGVFYCQQHLKELGYESDRLDREKEKKKESSAKEAK